MKFQPDRNGYITGHSLLQGRREHGHARRQPVDGSRRAARLGDLLERDRDRLAAGDASRRRSPSPPTRSTSRRITHRSATTPPTSASSRAAIDNAAAATPSRTRRARTASIGYTAHASGLPEPVGQRRELLGRRRLRDDRRARHDAAGRDRAARRLRATTGASVWTPVDGRVQRAAQPGDGDVGTVELRTPSTALCRRRSRTTPSTRTAMLQPWAALAPSTAYTRHGAGRRDRSARQGRRRQRARRQRRLVVHDDGGARRRRPTKAPAARSSSIASSLESVHAVLRRDPAGRGAERVHRQRHLARDGDRAERLRRGHPRRDAADVRAGHDVHDLGRRPAAT